MTTTPPNSQVAWWALAPSITVSVLTLALAPFRMIVLAADVVLAGAVLAIAGYGFAWYSGRLSDQDVVSHATGLGERVLGLLQGAGLL